MILTITLNPSVDIAYQLDTFHHEAGAKFNGVHCGRATWAGVVPVYIEKGEEAAREWLRTVGRENIEGLDAVLSQTATSWLEK